MEKSEDQFTPATPGKKTNITNIQSKMTMRTGDSQVNVGRESSTMHEDGSSPMTHTGPWRMAGSGKASELGVLFKQIRKLKEGGFSG